MLTKENTLLCVFSFNMGRTLRNCLESIHRHCGGFDLALIDDQSDDPETLAVLGEWQGRVVHHYPSVGDKAGKRHGNLYSNIQAMCDRAISLGYSFIFLIQDDMQFVRPMSPEICEQYGELLTGDHVLQVDPRFQRRMGDVDLIPEMKAYCFPTGDYRRSYADVGILDLQKIETLQWRFLESEPANKKALTAKGFLRVFPFTPVMMHVPFPRAYRKGRLAKSITLLRRGSYRFADMSESEILRMDSRPASVRPYFRDYLTPQNMGAAKLVYHFRKDSRIFS